MLSQQNCIARTGNDRQARLSTNIVEATLAMDITGFLFGNVNEEGELEDETLLDKVRLRLLLIRVHPSSFILKIRNV